MAPGGFSRESRWTRPPPPSPPLVAASVPLPAAATAVPRVGGDWWVWFLSENSITTKEQENLSYRDFLEKKKKKICNFFLYNIIIFASFNWNMEF